MQRGKSRLSVLSAVVDLRIYAYCKGEEHHGRRHSIYPRSTDDQLGIVPAQRRLHRMMKAGVSIISWGGGVKSPLQLLEFIQE